MKISDIEKQDLQEMRLQFIELLVKKTIRGFLYTGDIRDSLKGSISLINAELLKRENLRKI